MVNPFVRVVRFYRPVISFSFLFRHNTTAFGRVTLEGSAGPARFFQDEVMGRPRKEPSHTRVENPAKGRIPGWGG